MEVVQEVKRQCRVGELKDRGTIKVIGIENSQYPEASVSHLLVCPPLSPSSASASFGSFDTDILSSSDSASSSSSRTSWPVSFPVPQFSYDSELKLQRGNANYKKNCTPLIPDPKLKSNILEALIQEIVKY